MMRPGRRDEQKLFFASRAALIFLGMCVALQIMSVACTHHHSSPNPLVRLRSRVQSLFSTLLRVGKTCMRGTMMPDCAS